MHGACTYTGGMPKPLQIRNVPDSMHRTLKTRAATLGMSLSEYVLMELRVLAGRPSVQEWREQLAARSRTGATVRATAELRRERDRR